MGAEAYKLIENYSLVVDAFGFWPSFHDAEVCWLRLDRMKDCPGICNGSAVEFEIHFWKTTGEVDDDGYFRLVNHNLVHFRFEDVRDVELVGFNHQNVIFELEISEEPQTEEEMRHLKVVFSSCYGLQGEFKALRGAVIEVTPCNKNGETTSPGAPMHGRQPARPCAGPQEE